MKDEVCEKRRKEIDESTYQTSNLAGVLMANKIKQAYERECVFRSSSDSGGDGLPEQTPMYWSRIVLPIFSCMVGNMLPTIRINGFGFLLLFPCAPP